MVSNPCPTQVELILSSTVLFLFSNLDGSWKFCCFRIDLDLDFTIVIASSVVTLCLGDPCFPLWSSVG